MASQSYNTSQFVHIPYHSIPYHSIPYHSSLRFDIIHAVVMLRAWLMLQSLMLPSEISQVY